MPYRVRRRIVGVGVVAVLVGVVFAGRAESLARSSPSTPAAKPPSALLADPHGFPRTLSLYTCSDTEDLARRDMIVGYAYCDIDTLRRLNPNGVFLLVPGLFPNGRNEKGEPDYGGMSVTYGTGLWYWRQGYSWKDGGCDRIPGPINLGCMRQFTFDWDELRNTDGTRAGKVNGRSGDRGWNLADPTGKGTRELVAKFFAYTAKVAGAYTKDWDGVYSDNWIYGLIGASYVYGPTIDTDRDGKVDDLATLRRRWDDGLNEVGARIRAYLPKRIVVGNGNWLGSEQYYGAEPNGWLKSANGTMVESIERYYDDSSKELLSLASKWLSFSSPKPRYLLFLQNALDAKGDRLTVPSGANVNDAKYMLDPAVMRSMRWGLTLALMSGAYYEIVINGIHGTHWWYDEYDGGQGIRRRGYLGRAVSRQVLLEPGVWRRNFENGIALNNSSAKAVTIKFKQPMRHLLGTQDRQLNNGKIVSKVTLPSHDGIILLNVKDRAKKK